MRIQFFQNIIDIIRGKEYLNFYIQYRYKKVKKNINEKIKKNETVKVYFFFLSNMKSNIFYKYLYDKFSMNPHFEPFFVITPYNYLSEEYKKQTVFELTEILTKENYRVIPPEQFKHTLFSNSVCFFIDPYSYLVAKEYQLKNYILHNLTFYIPYSYMIASEWNASCMSVHRYAYKIFPDTKLHIDLLKKNSLINGSNIAPFLGYLGSQKLLFTNGIKYEWKLPQKNMKKVIIAPHHLLGFGNILRLSDFFIQIAKKYKEQISFVLKPHPILKESLKKYWSENTIEEYFALWDTMSNTKIEEGDYRELFHSSDAMILDSGSFNAEYSLLGKPLFFIDLEVPHEFNFIGQEILKYQYRGYEKEKIIDFIENVVLKNNDEKSNSRKKFIAENLMPSNIDVAQNIYDYICNDLNN